MLGYSIQANMFLEHPLFKFSQKSIGKKGKMIVKEVNDTVMEIFNITGFVDILTIE